MNAVRRCSRRIWKPSPNPSPGGRGISRRGLILPVVLVLVGLLALTMASFMFFVRAELAGTQARRDAQQARLAAESGLEELVTVLRESRDDPTTWYDVPDRFRHALVWAADFTREDDPVSKMGSRKELLAEGTPGEAWRYSLVAENLDGPPETIRYGVTPEAGKLNLNSASDAEIERLLTPLLLDLQIQNAPELIAALLDWRDTDDDPRSGGAESEYYNNLQPGYKPKSGRLDTLEELLLVKGWTAAALYGEDTNRNGLLDENEDDGEASFPFYDNGDSVLNLGIAPFVTVWSREPGKSSQGQTTGGTQEQGTEQESESGKQGSQESQKNPDEEAGEPLGDEDALESGAETTGQTGSTTGSQQSQMRDGLVNVNTASLRVLQALDNMPAEAAEAIVTLRKEMSGDALKSAEWLMTSGALDAGTYALIKDKITTRALQFHVEILGYGDHTQVARREEWIIEMHGSLAQVLYHRGLTELGLAWPIDDDTVLLTNR